MAYLLIKAPNRYEETMLDIAHRLGIASPKLELVQPSISGTDRPASQVVGRLSDVTIFINDFQQINVAFEYNFTAHAASAKFKLDSFEQMQMRFITDLAKKLDFSPYEAATWSDRHGLNNPYYKS